MVAGVPAALLYLPGAPAWNRRGLRPRCGCWVVRRRGAPGWRLRSERSPEARPPARPRRRSGSTAPITSTRTRTRTRARARARTGSRTGSRTRPRPRTRSGCAPGIGHGHRIPGCQRARELRTRQDGGRGQGSESQPGGAGDRGDQGRGLGRPTVAGRSAHRTTSSEAPTPTDARILQRHSRTQVTRIFTGRAACSTMPSIAASNLIGQ